MIVVIQAPGSPIAYSLSKQVLSEVTAANDDNYEQESA